MRYMGGKALIGKRLAEFLEYKRTPHQPYVEPFVGACGVFQHMRGPKHGNDLNGDLIAFWEQVVNGWVPPPYVSKDYYLQIQRHKWLLDHLPHMRAHVGIFCSFGGRQWHGYAQDKRGNNYANMASRSAVKIIPKIENATWSNLRYNELVFEHPSLIYCDPPYANVQRYNKEGFNTDAFWAWTQEKANEGHTVFVFEYQAPVWATCVLEIQKRVSLNNINGVTPTRTERLFYVEKE